MPWFCFLLRFKTKRLDVVETLWAKTWANKPQQRSIGVLQQIRGPQTGCRAQTQYSTLFLHLVRSKISVDPFECVKLNKLFKYFRMKYKVYKTWHQMFAELCKIDLPAFIKITIISTQWKFVHYFEWRLPNLTVLFFLLCLQWFALRRSYSHLLPDKISGHLL